MDPPVIIDISLPVGAATPVWPGDPPVAVEPLARVEGGDVAGVSRLVLGTHTGTHVDPPAHFFAGAPTVDALPLDVLVGPAVVCDFSAAPGPIDAHRLETAGLPAATNRILLKTRVNGDVTAEGALTADGAAWLADRAVQLVGADTLSIEPATGPGAGGRPPEEQYPVHRTLLGAGIVIVEGLDLTTVAAGSYQLVCLPLRITAGDGAPARAILIQDGATG